MPLQTREPTGLRDKARERFGSRPEAIRLHLPSPKLTDSYSVSIGAQDGHFIYTSRILTATDKLEDSGVAMQSGELVDASCENLNQEDDIWIAVMGQGTRSSTVFLHGGPDCPGPILLGVRFLDETPGALAPVLQTGLMTFGIALAIVLTEYATESLGGSGAAVFASFITIVPAISAAMAPVPAAGVPLLPRFLYGVQTLSLSLLVMWLLIRDRDADKQVFFGQTDGWLWNLMADLFSYWQFGGGVLVIASLFATLVLANMRLKAIFKLKREALKSNE